MTASPGAAIRWENGKCKQNRDRSPVVAVAVFPLLTPGIAGGWLVGVSRIAREGDGGEEGLP